MADECCDVSRIITTFLLNTCRLPPRLRQHDAQAVAYCAMMAGKHPLGDQEVEIIPLITGSVAEFYIEPMLPHVGDIDVMYHDNTQLAIPQGHPPPIQLPAAFHSYVKVAEIIDSHLPGYVYLQLRYLLTQCINDGKYNYTEYDEGRYLERVRYSLYRSDKIVVHGPAVFAENSNNSYLSVDILFCIRVVCRGRHKPLTGQRDTETTAGQTQQLLIALSACPWSSLIRCYCL